MKGKTMRSAGFAPKRDKNEPAIVLALEACGAVVQRISHLGVPDLLVGFDGRTLLVEVKNGRAKLNPNQVEWHQAWRGAAPLVVRDEHEAVAALGLRVVSPGMYKDSAGVLGTYPYTKERKSP